MNFPADLKYTEDHEWIRVNGNVGTIGVTEHAAGELGDVVYIDIPDDIGTVAKGDTLGTIEAVKTVADLFSPVSGKVVDVNRSLNDAPDNVNNDPYGEGWMIKIEISDLSELDSLMDADSYKATIGQ